MTKESLRELRMELGMTLEEFGEWLAKQVNEQQDPSLKPVSAYSRQRISEFELGRKPMPSKVETLLLKRELAEKNKLIQELRKKQRRKQKQ